MSTDEPGVPKGRREEPHMNAAAPPLIALENVKKVFYTDEVETHALDNVNLVIDQGEYVAIAGPSGCGKSTLLSILGLLDTPTDGLYRLRNDRVTTLSPAQRARVRNREIGFIFQSFNLIGDLSVYENVELPLTYRGMRSSELKERVHAALERVGMGHRAHHLPSQLSGGQQQRVAVARAVAGEPAMLLADLHRSGTTICMVTHDARYSSHANRTIHLFDGRVVEESVAVV